MAAATGAGGAAVAMMAAPRTAGPTIRTMRARGSVWRNGAPSYQDVVLATTAVGDRLRTRADRTDDGGHAPMGVGRIRLGGRVAGGTTTGHDSSSRARKRTIRLSDPVCRGLLTCAEESTGRGVAG